MHRSRPASIPEAFLAQSVEGTRVAGAKRTLSLLVIEEPAAIGPCLQWCRAGGSVGRCGHQQYRDDGFDNGRHAQARSGTTLPVCTRVPPSLSCTSSVFGATKRPVPMINSPPCLVVVQMKGNLALDHVAFALANL